MMGTMANIVAVGISTTHAMPSTTLPPPSSLLDADCIMRILTTVAFVMTTTTVFSLPSGDLDGVFFFFPPPLHSRQEYVDDGDYGHILGEDDAGYHGNVRGRWYFDDNGVPHPFPPQRWRLHDDTIDEGCNRDDDNKD